MKKLIATSILFLSMTGCSHAATVQPTASPVPSATSASAPASSSAKIPSIAAAQQKVQFRPLVTKAGMCLVVRQTDMDGKLSIPNRDELVIVNEILANPKAPIEQKNKFVNALKLALKTNNGKAIGIYQVKCSK